MAPSPARTTRTRGLGRQVGTLALIVVGFSTLAGCATKVSTRSFTLSAATEVNDRSAIAVDAVLVRDAELMGTIGALTARAWFEGREQFALDHPRGLEVVTWELVPGQLLEVRYPFRTRKGHAIYVFANYLTPGAHRVRVDELERFTLMLGRDGFATSGGR